MLAREQVLKVTRIDSDLLVHDNVGALNRACLRACVALVPAGTVVVLDICGLHYANHMYGMALVDKKLRLCHIKASDVVIRLGGDEYAIVCSTLYEAEKIVLRLSALYEDQGLSAYFEIQEYAVNLESAINIALDRIMARKEKRDSSFLARLRRAWGILVQNGAR